MVPPPDPGVVVVDDDPSVRDSVMTLLEAHGFRTSAFASGAEFLGSLAPDQQGCVLLDVHLPDMSGLELQRRLGAMALRMPVIIITAYADVALAVAAMKAGAEDFIEKPFADDVLLDTVRAALDRAGRAAVQAVSCAEIVARIARLTPREHEVMEELVLGRQNKQIAFDLAISPRTVEIHRAHVLEKMEARTLSQLVRLVMTARAVVR